MSGGRMPARGGEWSAYWRACWCAASLSAGAASLSAGAAARRAPDRGGPGTAPGAVVTAPCDSAVHTAVRALALPAAVAGAVRDGRGRHPDGAHGHTAVVASRTGVIERADVTLGLRAPGGRGVAPASPRDVQAVAAHEFGHVLGLVHRTESRSAMAPAVRPEDVSARDRAVLWAWYALPAAVSCQ